MGRREAQDRRNTLTCAGCVLSALGSVAALFVWASSSRTRRHLGGGFEGEGTDYVAVLVELPLVAVGGAAVPGLVVVLLARLTGRRAD
jgi:hypothetical protein